MLFSYEEPTKEYLLCLHCVYVLCIDVVKAMCLYVPDALICMGMIWFIYYNLGFGEI